MKSTNDLTGIDLKCRGVKPTPFFMTDNGTCVLAVLVGGITLLLEFLHVI